MIWIVNTSDETPIIRFGRECSCQNSVSMSRIGPRPQRSRCSPMGVNHQMIRPDVYRPVTGLKKSPVLRHRRFG